METTSATIAAMKIAASNDNNAPLSITVHIYRTLIAANDILKVIKLSFPADGL